MLQQESRDLVRVCYWSQASSVDWSTVGKGMLVRELQSVAVAGNSSVLVQLWLVAGHMAVLGMASQPCVTGC